jgi:hypothetical protein
MVIGVFFTGPSENDFRNRFRQHTRLRRFRQGGASCRQRAVPSPLEERRRTATMAATPHVRGRRLASEGRGGGRGAVADADTLTGYAVDRHGGGARVVLDDLLRDLPHDDIRAAVAEFGMQAVAEQYLRTLVADGTLQADEASAHAAADRMLAEDPEASPAVHTVSVAVLADEFVRLGLTEDAPRSMFGATPSRDDV